MREENNFVEELKEYFDKTPKEQVLKDWEATKEFDNNGVLADKLLDTLGEKRIWIDDTHFFTKPEDRAQVLKNWGNIGDLNGSEIPSDNFLFKTNELDEDETLKFVNKLLEFQEGIKSYNKEFSVFGDDITDYDKDYILQHIVITQADYLKFLNWRLGGSEGVFMPEWFDMNLKEIMIKDLNARKLNAELEIELLEDEIKKINKEIKRYENNSN